MCLLVAEEEYKDLYSISGREKIQKLLITIETPYRAGRY